MADDVEVAEEEEQDIEELSPGERLEVLLDELRLTQTALAEMCGVSPQYVNNIVRRGQRVTEDFARALAAAVDVDLNWLFTGKGPMLLSEHRVMDVPAEYQTVCVEDQLRNAAEHLQEAANQLSKARREKSCDHD
jgi:transcriptional regulator with XRE-family HTH domain